MMIPHDKIVEMSYLAMDSSLVDNGVIAIPVRDNDIVLLCSIGRFDDDDNEIFEGDIIETSSGLKRDNTGGFSEDKYLWCYHSIDYLYGRLIPAKGRIVGNKFTDKDLFDKIVNKETGETQ
jgi:uncharacterized phage protein (TIGR01671 family)